MEIGNKILELRKKANLSQEELAEKVGVTRQTISKWELEETSPDIAQAKKISQIFKVSLDELVNNDTQTILVEKVSNTEKLSTIILKLLRILFIITITVLILGIVCFGISRIKKAEDRTIMGKFSIECKLNNEEYFYEIEYNKNYQVINCGGDDFIANHIDLDKYENANQMVAHIEDYFKDHGGECKIVNANN